MYEIGKIWGGINPIGQTLIIVVGLAGFLAIILILKGQQGEKGDRFVFGLFCAGWIVALLVIAFTAVPGLFYAIMGVCALCVLAVIVFILTRAMTRSQIMRTNERMQRMALEATREISHLPAAQAYMGLAATTQIYGQANSLLRATTPASVATQLTEAVVRAVEAVFYDGGRVGQLPTGQYVAIMPDESYEVITSSEAAYLQELERRELNKQLPEPPAGRLASFGN